MEAPDRSDKGSCPVGKNICSPFPIRPFRVPATRRAVRNTALIRVQGESGAASGSSRTVARRIRLRPRLRLIGSLTYNGSPAAENGDDGFARRGTRRTGGLMKYRHRLLIILALAVALLAVQTTATLAAATGRYVSVEVEMFKPWGLFGLGTWQPLPEALQRYSTFSLPAEEADAVGDEVAAIASANPSAWPQILLSGDPRGHAWVYGIDPELGAAYRIRLANNTSLRLGVVVEIDGLNTLGSEWVAQTSDDRMWILAPNETIVIAGWQISSEEALEFRFGVPSHTHSPLIERRGQITVYAYLEDPRAGERATTAGAVIEQPVRYVGFASLTDGAVETVSIRYGEGDAYLGIDCAETAGGGVRIVAVDPGSPAELYGLRPNDVITYLNTIPISSCQQFDDLLAARHSGDRVVFKLHRESLSFLVAVELGD